MKKISTREEHREWAREKAKDLGRLKNSITSGKGNYAGFLGEAIAALYLGAQLRNTYNFDISLGDQLIDVKSKNSTVVPKKFYECSVSDYNTSQKCDSYLFTRVVRNDVYLLGYLPKKQFYDIATFHKEGERDESNNFTFHCDCYNVKISDLLDIDKLKPLK